MKSNLRRCRWHTKAVIDNRQNDSSKNKELSPNQKTTRRHDTHRSTYRLCKVVIRIIGIPLSWEDARIGKTSRTEKCKHTNLQDSTKQPDNITMRKFSAVPLKTNKSRQIHAYHCVIFSYECHTIFYNSKYTILAKWPTSKHTYCLSHAWHSILRCLFQSNHASTEFVTNVQEQK